MGIFDFLKTQSSSAEEYIVKDERRAECPYCQKDLKKVPGRKTKCPHCGEFMLVRTRPNDNVRVVVTQEEAGKIEEEWAIFNGTHDDYLAEKEKIKKEKKALKNRFGKDPTENDVHWSLLNKSLIEHAQNGDWGLYRCARFDMAEILRKEKKLKRALQAYLEVSYIDLNGPNNLGGVNDEDSLKIFPPFDPVAGYASLAPGVIDIIRKIIKRINIDMPEVKTIFIRHNSLIEKSLRLPLSAKDAWLSMKKEI